MSITKYYPALYNNDILVLTLPCDIIKKFSDAGDLNYFLQYLLV